MSASLVANVFSTGSLTVSGSCTSSRINTQSCSLLTTSASPLNGQILFSGIIGIGLVPSSYQLDLSTDDARKLSTSVWTTGSDMRIKNNIQTANLVRCAEIVDTLDLKYFEWTYDTEDKHALGWIAQDVQPFFPRSVVPDDQGILILNSDQLIKVLFGALKQTQREFFPGEY